MRKNYLALIPFFVLLLFVINTQGAVLHSDIDAHLWLNTSQGSYEVTIPTAEILTYADLDDYEKGAHYTVTEAEGEAVNLNGIISNNHLTQTYTAEVHWRVRYKIGDGSWSILHWNNTKGNITPRSSVAQATETQDLKQTGLWREGNQIHIGFYMNVYPSINPSDYEANAWSVWYMIVPQAQATNPPGDGTTTSPGTTGPSYSYGGLLGIFDPLAQALGTSRIGAVAVVVLIGICVFTVIVIVLTKNEEW